MTDTDAVAAVLATTWAGESEALYDYLTGERSAEDLTYEDWVGPMSATAGRVCLRVKAASGDRWLRWSARDEIDCCLRRDGELDVNYDWPSEAELRNWLDLHTVEPVLIEDTPFAILGGPGRRELSH